MRYFQLSYPENKVVSEKKIEIWFSDAVMNGEIELDNDYEEQSIRDMIDRLEDIGFITVVREII